jgi:hypothetical protein
MTQRALVAKITLACGTILLMVGLFGVYYQGPFWASGVVAAMNPDEDALALGLPTGVTLAGSFLISYAILASELTAHWIPRTRTIVFTLFALAVLVACGLAAWMAGQVAGKTLQTTQAFPIEPNKAVNLTRSRWWFKVAACCSSPSLIAGKLPLSIGRGC